MAKYTHEYNRSKLSRFIRYRWEFMRRDPEYRSRYKEIAEIKKNDPNQPVEREKEYCREFGIRTGALPDPDKSFEEVFQITNDKNTDSVNHVFANIMFGTEAPALLRW